MSSETKGTSLKGLSHKQILAETDHFFNVGKDDESGPECFLLAEKEHLLQVEFDALENNGAPLAELRAVLLEMRAVIRSMEIMGCYNGGGGPR